MNEKNTLKKLTFTAIVLLFVLSLGVKDGFSALVNEDEAIAVADLLYAMELNSGYTKIDETERVSRLDSLQNRQVLYLVSKEELRDSRPDKGEVLAYVIKYEPTGFVVVSGEDRIEPIVVFDAKSRFRWDQPELNFLRYFLGKAIVGRWECLETKAAEGVIVDVHPKWSYLRSKLQEDKRLREATYEATEESIYVKWDTALWSQNGYYNDVVTAQNGGITGIPTGCTATAMAIKMRFHSYPLTGNSSHSYDDIWGDVQYSHSVNFGDASYNWSEMPTWDLFLPNYHVANLMYHCGVAVEMNYEVGESGAWPSGVAMNTYFRYYGTVEIMSSHSQPMIRSIKGRLPVIIRSSSHALLACGYQTIMPPQYGYFYLNCGWGGTNNGWYNLDDIPCGDPLIERSYPYSRTSNYVYVDGSWTGPEYGTPENPYSNLSEANHLIPHGGHLRIKAGTYTGTDNVPIVFGKPMSIKSYEGTVIIGDNLSMTTDGSISIYCPLLFGRCGALRIY